ncbi:MAG: hypothetical protein AAF720_06415 [Pseudomonadota bacterium]
MTYIKWSLALVIGAVLIFFGVMKFTGGAHIFPYIEYKATAANLPLASLFFPFVNYATGLLEIVAGLLLIIPASRVLGAVISILPFLGAVTFHVSPFLGIVTPDSYSDPRPIAALSAGGPFTVSDFSSTSSASLFTIASAMLVLSIINVFIQRRFR